jgi:hypothetical protein
MSIEEENTSLLPVVNSFEFSSLTHKYTTKNSIHSISIALNLIIVSPVNTGIPAFFLRDSIPGSEVVIPGLKIAILG